MEVPELLRTILSQRGIRTDEEIDRFLNPCLDGLARPEELPGVTDAARILGEAVRMKRKIVVFGDYDCDGVSATAILVKAIRSLDGDVEPFIPRRLDEGYGMSEASVERMLDEHPDVALVVTVDNGINALEPVLRLKEARVEVVVTDHHLPSVNMYGHVLLPAALAVVDPKVAAPAHLSDLCGAAVAFLLARALVELATKEGWATGRKVGGELVVLAGLATVTDVMPLVGQNRILVAEALRHFHTWAPIGLRELLERASRSAARLTSRDFGFALGPRINAAGRLTTAMDALELLVSDDREVAREAARIVDVQNAERKQIESEMHRRALAQVDPGAAAQVIDIPDGHQGIAGVVAARVMESLEKCVPTCVIVGGHGSARAPDGYNVRDALKASVHVDPKDPKSDLVLSRFGGHAAAAGFSVKEGMVGEFRRLFREACAAQKAAWDPSNPPPAESARFDLDVVPKTLSLENVEALSLLEPYGEGNPEPAFRMAGVPIGDIRVVGADGKHLSLTVNGMKAVWWGKGDRLEDLRAKALQPQDVVFAPFVSEYGERHVELRILSVRDSGA